MAIFHFWDRSISIDKIDEFPTRNDFEKLVKKTVIDWLRGKSDFELKTSGSTGKPKSIRLKREQLQYSASCTLQACKLSTGMKALLCISPEYIGGKMMIIRAIIGNLDLYLIEPKANPLKEFERVVSFASFVPLQIHEILKTNKEKLEAINQVIIGGASVPHAEVELLSSFNNCVYSTYGMTETVSHIALKQLAPTSENYFKTLGDVNVSVDGRSCLIIKGSVTDHKQVITNDIVEILSENTFRWIGRVDNVINSGGYKVHPEKIESHLSAYLNRPFFIGQSKNVRLGNAVTLYVEGKSNLELDQIQHILSNAAVHKYELPLQIIELEKFIRTDSGKINRKAIQDRYFS